MSRSPAGPKGPRGAFLSATREDEPAARTSPGEFIRQVRIETSKVHWPTRKETIATGIMVMIMTLVLAFFFFGVDAAFSTLVKKLLSFLA